MTPTDWIQLTSSTVPEDPWDSPVHQAAPSSSAELASWTVAAQQSTEDLQRLEDRMEAEGLAQTAVVQVELLLKD